MSLLSKAREQVNRGGQYLSDTPVDEPSPDSWLEGASVTQSDVDRQINDRGEKPPNLLTPFKQKVAFNAPQPSDKLNTQTFFLVGGAAPVSIVNAQDAGVACRVTLINLGDGAGSGKVLIAPNGEQLRPSITGVGQAMAFSLPPPTAAGYPAMPFTIHTSSGLQAICVNAANVIAELSVLVETYDPDAYTWETWEVGRQ